MTSPLIPCLHFRRLIRSRTLRRWRGRCGWVEQTLAQVSHYDPWWQLRYDLADEIELPQGTRIDTNWTFNNAQHRYNPDPTAKVRWGDQTWEEMALMEFAAVVPMNTRDRFLISASGR